MNHYEYWSAFWSSVETFPVHVLVPAALGRPRQFRRDDIWRFLKSWGYLKSPSHHPFLGWNPWNQPSTFGYPHLWKATNPDVWFSAPCKDRASTFTSKWCWLENQLWIDLVVFLLRKHPIGSMYGICTYIWAIFGVNVGTYSSTMDPMGMLWYHVILNS